MAMVEYTAQRDLASGHSQGSTYYIDFGASQLNRQVSRVAITNKSISGVRETIHQRNEVKWDITATFIAAADLEDWREFIGSVSHGETFTIDLWGTYASPVETFTAVMDSDSWTETILDNVGNYFSISFTVEIV